MKHSTASAISAFAFLWISISLAQAGDALREGFANPPDSARPHTWWHWMNGNVSREGITKDLEAMKRVGLGGFQAFSVTDGIPAPAKPVGYMSKEWLELMGHAAKEADRLGLEMCMHNCAGWSSSGGPWISAEASMQEIVWTETSVHGGKKVEVELKRPEARKDFYRDVAVIAFPSVGNFRLENWEWKIDRNKAGRKPDSQITRETREAPGDSVIKLAEVVVLSNKMDASGKLSWDAPAGPREWTVLRFGHTTTGRTNKPAPKEGEGLECNKLDRAAVKLHWDNSVARVLEAAGPLAGKVLNNVLIDSYEVGFQNWTSGFEKMFAERAGYELTKYMPCLTGRIVESVDTSERFLWDFRRVIADVMAENYFGYFKELCNQKGLKLSIEPYGPGGFDDFQVAGIADIPMGEFWIDRGDAWHLWSVKLAASAAHANGLKVVGAESFTANPPASRWNDYPSRIKTLGDSFFAQGLNRIIFHTNVHQPWGDDVLPGMTMGPHGMQMNRNNTWHAIARPWVDHLARTQFLLQSGEPVVAICRMASEDAPQTPDGRPTMPGYDYDMLHYSFVMQMRVKDGRLVLPSGMSYAMLELPDTDRMRPELLGKIVELKKAGATVFVPRKITAAPGIKGDEQVRVLSDELPVDPPSKVEGRTGVLSVHRRIDGKEVYFLSNQEQREVTVGSNFGEKGEAEVWHTFDGTIERAGESITLGPEDSVFVVFVEKSTAPAAKKFVAASDIAIDGPWTVTFPFAEAKVKGSWADEADERVKYFSGTAKYSMRFAAPADAKAARLDLGDVGVMAQVKLNGKELGLLWKKPFVVDLSAALRGGENELEVSVTNTWANRLIGDERFEEVAEYKADARGRGAGIAKIPDWLEKGEKMPETRRQTFVTWKHYKKDDPLQPAGLMGPVVVKFGTKSSSN